MVERLERNASGVWCKVDWTGEVELRPGGKNAPLRNQRVDDCVALVRGDWEKVREREE